MNGPTPDMVREQVGKGLAVELRLRGRSMLPVLPPGVVLLLRSARGTDLEPGAVVVFERGGRMICHRVESVAGAPGDLRLTTRGVFLDRADAPVPLEALVAVVVGVRIGGRTVPLDGPAFAAWTRLVEPATAGVAAAAGLARRLVPARWRRRIAARLHL